MGYHLIFGDKGLRLIGIAGKMESGKDAIANVLAEYCGFTKIAMADALREECAELLMARKAPNGSPIDIRAIIERYEYHPSSVWLKPTPYDMRRLLQWGGTEWRRSQNPDYWVNKMRERLSDAIGCFVVPDIRFENEAALIREFGGAVWLAERPNIDRSASSAHSHVSERFCDEYRDWDRVILNIGTLEELKERVIGIMQCEAELERINHELANENLSPSERFLVTLGDVDWRAELRTVEAA